MPHQTQENLENLFRKIKDFLGKLRKDSDIDVTIYVKNPISGYELLSLVQKLSKSAFKTSSDEK